MAKGNKKSKVAVGVIILFLIIAFFPAIMRSVVSRKHPQIDTWYIDETGCFTDSPEVIITAEENFYNKTGIQPVVYITSFSSNNDASIVYDELFDDEEHILIYIAEIRVNNGDYVYTEIPNLNDPEASREYLYEVTGYSKEVFIGSDTLDNRELRILKRNLTLADIHGEFGPYELATVINKAANELNRASLSSIVFTAIETIRKIAPALLFIGTIVIIVRVANKTSNKTEYSQTPTEYTPAEVSKPDVSKEEKAKPIWETTTPAVTAEPIPEPTPEATPAVETIVEPEISAIDNQLIDIKPIEPIKIEPVNFDFDANNIIDTNIDTNFDDWGNL
ncbi:MAG: hypothetical protein MJ094_07395 [Saccharofermentans sp.]|nr:hypothetical protein [Saccharofermentans sp.]